MCLPPEAMDPQLTDPILRLAKIPTGKRPVRQDVEGSVAKASLLWGWERHTLVRLFPRADRIFLSTHGVNIQVYRNMGTISARDLRMIAGNHWFVEWKGSTYTLTVSNGAAIPSQTDIHQCGKANTRGSLMWVGSQF